MRRHFKKKNPQYASEIREFQNLYTEVKIRNYETAKRTKDNLTARNPKDRLKAKKNAKKRRNWNGHGLASSVAMKKGKQKPSSNVNNLKFI